MLMVHSSLAALGSVDGGADTVIDALVDAVGPEGTVVVPTFACDPPFDRKTSATPLGAIADRFWRRPEAVRSKHPTHSVSAIGKNAEELIRGHEKASTAYGEGTPYLRLARGGGKILLLGVDQDRNTTLHTAEAIAGAPYLDTIESTYVDDDGTHVTIPIEAMAGPHRDFIGLDLLFRERGIMNVGTIGAAVCRLMDAGRMLETALEALANDPAAMLCENLSCADCVMLRGRIKAARLSKETFTVAAVAGDISEDLDEVIAAIRDEGISALELTPDEFERWESSLTGVDVTAIRGRPTSEDAWLADSLGVPLIIPAGNQEELETAVQLEIETSAEVLVENDGTPPSVYSAVLEKMQRTPGLAFNPALFAATGAKPFLEVFYRGSLRKHTRHFYVDDGTFDGHRVLPGCGNGEVKEIISMLRCRSFAGTLTLRSHSGGVAGFRATAAAFRRLRDNMLRR
jgi:aminoglycoside 3-N-acetyltransferase